VRVALDTNTVLFGLLSPRRRLAWLRDTWTGARVLPLVCSATVCELIRALAYPKFEIRDRGVQVCLAAYLPFTESVDLADVAAIEVPLCREPDDQVFLQIAAVGGAEVIVTGYADILEPADRAAFTIEAPTSFKRRLG